ncbi:MAG: RNA-guided endonuclease IscB [Clostridiaceae bacterium]
MILEKEYSLVIDSEGKKLSPTPINNGWFLIRKGKAKLISKYPMVIQLLKSVEKDEMDTSDILCGIDDGSKHVGLALVQRCKTKNKVVFKGQIEQRNDVQKLMTVRRGYRSYRRFHKRHRVKRFDNRASSKRKGRIAPSIKQKKDSILRVINQLNKWVKIREFWLEDVMIDIRALTDEYKSYSWQYQKSNRLDENLRKAVILRDKCNCAECGKTNTILEVHHIRARRYYGSNTLRNLITLCASCHQNTEGREKEFEEKYFKLINGKNVRLDYAQHVMQGKSYLRQQLSLLGALNLTNGGDTANKRIDWAIEKSHGNDAAVITGLEVNSTHCEVKEWIIKPMRRKSKAKTDHVLGIKHRDFVSYTFKNGDQHTGYVTALYPELKALNFQSKTKHCKKVNARKCKLIWKFNKIYWLECA